jgi:hypothetical protein
MSIAIARRFFALALLLLAARNGLGAGFSISGGTVTLANAAQLSTTNDLTISSGSLVANLSNVVIGGNWTNSGGSFTAGTSTVTFNSLAIGKTITSKGFPFYNVYFSGSGGYWTLQDSMTVTSTATIANGTLDTNSATNLGIQVSGDWNFLGGTFVPNASTVTFAGAATSSSTLRGSTTFYSLSCIIPSKTLVFQINSTQTVTNLFTLTGASGNLIQVKSTTGGSSGYLNNSGTNNVSFVRAQDNNANAGSTILAGANSTNVSNNTNWLFAAPTLTITTSTGAYNFGLVNLAATTISTLAITITNGGTATENYSISVATTGAQTVWGVATSTPTGFDNFALFGLWNSVQPSSSSFLTADILISTPTASTTSIYAGDQNAVHVPTSAARKFWMCLYTAQTTDTNLAQQMNLVITAAAP